MIAGSAPPLRLHHVGHAVAEIEPSADAYCERFGYQVASPAIHDPAQTAIVQFLHLPPDPTYLELVAPDSAQSKLSAFVRKGGGLHHLCYSTPDLASSVEALSLAGLRLIADPAPATAFAGRLICWLLAPDRSLVELVERRSLDDRCEPAE